ncbi:MAG TPA: hypothetical protein PKN32_10600 [Bacteroidales bacterium]|nr:hypothetical protein [Bacteroidales bacterium]
MKSCKQFHIFSRILEELQKSEIFGFFGTLGTLGTLDTLGTSTYTILSTLALYSFSTSSLDLTA